MIPTYFKLACRSLISKKHNSYISVLGLGIGIATAMLVGAYIVNENSFDKFQKNYSRIYRIVNKTSHTTELDKEYVPLGDLGVRKPRKLEVIGTKTKILLKKHLKAPHMGSWWWFSGRAAGCFEEPGGGAEV
jgi:hypothetical protein